MMDLRAFVHGLPAFERFQGKQLDALLANLRMSDYAPGHCFVSQGQQGAALYLIVSGTVDILSHDPVGGAEDEAHEARDGEVFGLLSLVDDMPSPETCTARGRVIAAELTPERYRALFLLAPSVAHQLQYMVAVQLARELQRENTSLRKGLASRKPKSLLERLFGA